MYTSNTDKISRATRGLCGGKPIYESKYITLLPQSRERCFVSVTGTKERY